MNEQQIDVLRFMAAFMEYRELSGYTLVRFTQSRGKWAATLETTDFISRFTGRVEKSLQWLERWERAKAAGVPYTPEVKS